jgi:hypothetical protein
MDSTDTTRDREDHGRPVGHGVDRFGSEIGDESFRFVPAIFDDRRVAGTQIVAAFGKHPVKTTWFFNT